MAEMDFLEPKVDELGDVDEELERNSEKISELRDKRQELNQEKKGDVVEALYQIQDSLEEDEYFHLVTNQEFSRKGGYQFKELLTSEGVVAEVTTLGRDGYEFTSSDLHDWPSEDEPLDIEEEYLAHHRRNTAKFIDKLAQRIESAYGGEDKVSQDTFFYD